MTIAGHKCCSLHTQERKCLKGGSGVGQACHIRNIYCGHTTNACLTPEAWGRQIIVYGVGVDLHCQLVAPTASQLTR